MRFGLAVALLLLSVLTFGQKAEDVSDSTLAQGINSPHPWGGVGGGETRQIALSFPPTCERLRERGVDQLTEEV